MGGVSPSYPPSSAADVPWITIDDADMENGWITVFLPVQYRKVGDMVQIRGAVMSGTVGTTIYTLPSGYRPAIAYASGLIGGAPGDFSTSQVTNVQITSAGAIAETFLPAAFCEVLLLDGTQFSTT